MLITQNNTKPARSYLRGQEVTKLEHVLQQKRTDLQVLHVTNQQLGPGLHRLTTRLRLVDPVAYRVQVRDSDTKLEVKLAAIQDKRRCVW
jgi:hypothetical protein